MCVIHAAHVKLSAAKRILYCWPLSAKKLGSWTFAGHLSLYFASIIASSNVWKCFSFNCVFITCRYVVFCLPLGFLFVSYTAGKLKGFYTVTHSHQRQSLAPKSLSIITDFGPLYISHLFNTFHKSEYANAKRRISTRRYVVALFSRHQVENIPIRSLIGYWSQVVLFSDNIIY